MGDGRAKGSSAIGDRGQAAISLTSDFDGTGSGSLLDSTLLKKQSSSARFGSTYTKIETIQRKLAWPLRKDDTQIREAFHI